MRPAKGRGHKTTVMSLHRHYAIKNNANTYWQYWNADQDGWDYRETCTMFDSVDEAEQYIACNTVSVFKQATHITIEAIYHQI